jgi:hypothetical protein
VSTPAIPATGSSEGAATDVAETFGIAASGPIRMPATFTFDCYGIPFDAAMVVAENESGARLTVRGRLGTVPYSAECPTTRQYMHAIVDAGKELPFADLSLTSGQAVVARGTMDFPEMPSPASVAAGASVIVVALKPVIELMTACREMAKARRA